MTMTLKHGQFGKGSRLDTCQIAGNVGLLSFFVYSSIQCQHLRIQSDQGENWTTELSHYSGPTTLHYTVWSD